MRYLITFSYDGSKFKGYQKQPRLKTVQGEIEKALKKINSNKKVMISASGRTDALVHAYNQKAHFDLDQDIPLDKLKKSLNGLIDKYIYIKDIEYVSDTFHARFDVKHKEYIYKINVGEYNPIEKDYIYQYNKQLNLENMKKAIKYFEGTHDFKSFSKSNEEQDDFVRTIIKTDISKDPINKDIIILTFSGTGFLRYQVRNMVGLLIEIGEGKRTSEAVLEILKACDRTKAGITAPPCGLYLKNVVYK